MQNKPLELPLDIMTHQVFPQLSLKTLCSTRCVSKGWENTIWHHAPFNAELAAWLSPLDKIFSIVPTERLKRYVAIQNKIHKINNAIKPQEKKRGFFGNFFQETVSIQKCFKQAVMQGDCDVVHALLKDCRILVNTHIEEYFNKISMYNASCSSEVIFYLPLFYLWKFTTHADLVKLFLAYRANPDPQRMKQQIYYYNSNSKTLLREGEISEKYCPLERPSFLSRKILSLIYIGYAESCLRAKPRKTDEAIAYFKESYQLSVEVIQEYSETVRRTRRGFALHYSNNRLKIFHDALEAIESSVCATKHEKSASTHNIS